MVFEGCKTALANRSARQNTEEPEQQRKPKDEEPRARGKMHIQGGRTVLRGGERDSRILNGRDQVFLEGGVPVGRTESSSEADGDMVAIVRDHLRPQRGRNLRDEGRDLDSCLQREYPSGEEFFIFW